MTKKLKYFSLSLAMMVAFGHSVLPHSHQFESSANYQFLEATGLSLLDIIKIGLTHDIGVNHLKDYSSCKTLEFFSTDDQNAEFYKLIEHSALRSEEDDQKIYLIPNISTGRKILKTSFLRGPPSC
jgi:hypothetical protein